MKSLLSGLLLLAAALLPAAAQTHADEPVALVNGEPVSAADLDAAAAPALADLRARQFEIESASLEKLIRQRLLEAEARRQGVQPEALLMRQADATVSEPTDGEVLAHYLALPERDRQPLDRIETQLRSNLRRSRILYARQLYLDRLRAQADVSILLHRERLKVEADPARTRGNPAAPVVLVEFADFQCPYCRKQEPILASLLQRYAGKLAIAYRDDPVAELHPKAALAASAAQCAAAQQQFWPYYQKLVAGDLDAASLNRYADELALDQPRFAACLAAPETAAAVEADRQRALELGVAGTPTFFLNGIRLIGAQTEEAFARAIDRELAQPRP